MYDLDEPRLPVFRHLNKPSDEDGKTENDLLDRIQKRWLKAAVAVYNNMDDNVKNNLSTQTLQDLFELLCFCNGAEIADLRGHSEWPEQNYYTENELPGQEIELKVFSKTPPAEFVWKDNDPTIKLAEDLFTKLSLSDDPEVVEKAHVCMICGLAKHHSYGRAWQLYEEMKGKGLRLNLQVINRSQLKLRLWKGYNGYYQCRVTVLFTHLGIYCHYKLFASAT